MGESLRNMFEDTFGDLPPDRKAPFIRLDANIPFIGKVKHIAGKKRNSFGNDIIEFWFFDDDLGERSLDVGKALGAEMVRVDAREGDTLKVMKTIKMATDPDGKPIWRTTPEGDLQHDENGNPIQLSYTNFRVEVVMRGGAHDEVAPAAAPAEAAPAKPAAKKAVKGAAEEEINTDDIPF